MIKKIYVVYREDLEYKHIFEGYFSTEENATEYLDKKYSIVDRPMNPMNPIVRSWTIPELGLIVKISEFPVDVPASEYNGSST